MARFGDDPDPAMRQWVAMALLSKGITLGQLDRSEDAIAGEVVTRFGGDPELAIRKSVNDARTAKEELRSGDR